MKRAAIPVLVLLLAACGTPDRWYDPAPGADGEPPAADTPALESAIDPVPVLLEDAPLDPLVDHDGPLELRVEDAVLLAMTRNPDLRVRRYDPVIAATFEQIERGVYDPEVVAALELERERASETDRGTGQRFSVDGEAERARLGLEQRLPTGTELALGVSQERETSDRTPDQQETRLALSVTQALLRGFGPAVNLASVRQAALDARISRFELRAFTEALVAETERAYWRLALAEERIVLVERSLQVAEAQRDDTRHRIELGAAPSSAAAATRSEVARRQQALIEAEAARDASRLRLLRLVAPPPRSDYERALALTSPAAIEPEALDELATRIALARSRRPELGEARSRLEQRRLETVVTANGLLPRLDFFVELGKSGYGETASESLRELDGDSYDLTVGLDFGYRLGDRAADARRVAAIASTEQARAAITNLEHLVEFELRLAWTEVERQRRLIVAAATTAELQAETLAAEEERLAAGASIPLLVAQAQRDLLAAQLAALEAQVGYRIAVVELWRAEGTLLERRGIDLGD